MKILLIITMDSNVTDQLLLKPVFFCFFMQVFTSTLTFSPSLKVKTHNALADVQLWTFDKFVGTLKSYAGMHTS
jgi:hypothetical protein